MVQGLNSGPLRGIGRISCVTCHRGQTRPARLPLEAWQNVEKASQAAFEGTPEGTSLSMSVYSASLGVGCDHCHAKGDWKSSGKPPYRTSQVMTSLFELIPRYFEGSERKPRTQCFMCHQGGIRPAR